MLGFILTGILVIVLIVRECGKAEFSAELAALLSRRLEAEVEMLPMSSHSLVFVDCPSVQVKDRDGRWAFRAEHVSFELLPSAILTGGLGFRSVLIRKAEVWLGAEPGQEGEERIGGMEGDGGRLPWWMEGRLRDLSRVPMDSIRISSLTIRGHESLPKDATFQADTAANGRLSDGRLEWRLEDGRFEVPGQTAWDLGRFEGIWAREGLRVEQGLLTSPDGAVIACRSLGAQGPGDLVLDIDAREVRFQSSGAEVEEAVGSISAATATVQGVLQAEFPEVQRFHFAGDLEVDGLRLGESRIFRLLAGQTGDERLTHPETPLLTGRMECTPGVVRLTQLTCAEEGLFQLKGWLSIVAEEVLGVFDLALPVPMVGRIPGGKPKGFSYPASGWSWARLRVEGKGSQWQEDLSQRLMAQISRDIPVKAGLPVRPVPGMTINPEGEKSPGREARAESVQRREAAMERLFYSLIGD